MKTQTLMRRKDLYRYRWYKIYSSRKNTNYKWSPVFHPVRHFTTRKIHGYWGGCNFYSGETDYCYQTSLVKAYLEKVWLDIKPEIRKEFNNDWVKYLFKINGGNTNAVIEEIKEYYPDFNVEENPAWIIKFQFTWNSKE